MSVHERSTGDWTVADPAAHDRRVRGMFARIAGVYDFMNHFLSFNRDKAWRREVVRRLDADTDLLLDLFAGTGDLGRAALDGGRARRVVAADFCTEMLRAGGGKGLGGELPAVTADAQRLPLRDGCVDALSAGFGVRNLGDLKRGVAEARRVLRPDGRLLVLDFFRADPGAEGEARGVPPLVRWYLDTIVPLLGRAFGDRHAAYTYLPASMGRFVTPREFAGLLDDAGFDEIFIARQTLGIAHIIGGRAR